MKQQMCVRCVLDTTAEDITFDNEGVCNYCRTYDQLARKTVERPKEVIREELNEIIRSIKKQGEGQEYDCLIGLSGGVDSTYVCYIAKQLGLRPLVVHFDNGWNSELAVKNIENVITKLQFPLHTYVVDWEEFKDLQLSYLKASVLDIEVPTDQLIYGSVYRIARQKNIHTILSGSNVVTEGVIPANWNFMDKTDLVNLKNIHKKYGTKKLRNFPKLGLYQRYYYTNFYGLRSIPILDYIHYNKKEAKETMKKELDWKDYGGKHYESIFTRFYQGYILVEKFGIDKRKMHFSSLICSGQMTREQALEKLKQPPYDKQLLAEDREYVLKKFGLTETEFEKIMKQKPVPHSVFGTQWDKEHFRKYYLFTLLMKPVLGVYKLFKRS
jgi:N-acetyl sugar amidotransferase